MLYLPITRGWMVSRRAQRVYFCCAIANLYLFAVLLGTFSAMAASGVVFLADHSAAPLVRILLWPGVVGAGILAIAMWYFWFSFDQSYWTKKACWFVVLILGLALGPVIYYFFAYRRNQALESR
jgi:energy-converting hydrogenase Eha subunit G